MNKHTMHSSGSSSAVGSTPADLPFTWPVAEDTDDVVSSIPAPPRESASASTALRSGPAGKAATEPSRRHPVVTVEPLGGPARRLEVDGPRFLIGRERADLPLDDPFVSDWHAQLFISDGALVLEDLRSQNGIYLRIADELVLEDRDEIVIGMQRMVFRTTWDEAAVPAIGTIPPALGAPAHGAARLIEFVEGGHISGVHALGDRLVIGRQNADIVRPGDELLSAPHASIERRGGRFYLRDLHSQFGTFIRVRGAVELIDGDCFLIGRTRLRVSYP